MKPLILNSKNARQIYPIAPPELKIILEDSFGKGFFSQDTMDYIKTLDDAINATGDKLIINPGDTPDEVAYKKLKIIYKALNNDPKFPDYRNNNQSKYYPYVKHNQSGVGLSSYVYVVTYSGTYVGSRLVLNRKELCKYVVEQFPDIVAAYYML